MSESIKEILENIEALITGDEKALVAEVAKYVDDLEAKVTKLENDVKAFETKVEELEGKVKAFETKVEGEVSRNKIIEEIEKAIAHFSFKDHSYRTASEVVKSLKS